MIATLALCIWPFVSMVFFRIMTLPWALCATLMGGYLLLPTRTSLDLPLLPALDKYSVPALSAIVITAIVAKGQFQTWPVRPGWLPQSRMALALLALLVFGVAGTMLTNGDAIQIGRTYLPALTPYDAFSSLLTTMTGLIPFFLGRKVLASEEGQRVLLLTLVYWAIGYSFLALYEVRMSPQLNNMVYGFFPHSWQQHLRAGGYRPLVFLVHGLMLGLFLGMAAIAAFGLFRHDQKRRSPLWIYAGLWLLIVLFVSKALGALIITVLAIALLFLVPRRLQIVSAATVCIMALSYPVMRGADIVPVDSITEIAKSISDERARSFEFRVINEDMLLEKARERPLFGWGGWGRNRAYSEAGNDLSTTDGFWIIELGQGGWIRYIAIFGLLTWGVIAQLGRRHGNTDGVNITFSLILAANVVDLLPNASIFFLTWLMAGSLIGRLETAEDPVQESNAVDATAKRTAAPVLTRFGVGAMPVSPARTVSGSATQRRRPVSRRTPEELKLRK